MTPRKITAYLILVAILASIQPIQVTECTILDEFQQNNPEIKIIDTTNSETLNITQLQNHLTTGKTIILIGDNAEHASKQIVTSASITSSNDTPNLIGLKLYQDHNRTIPSILRIKESSLSEMSLEVAKNWSTETEFSDPGSELFDNMRVVAFLTEFDLHEPFGYLKVVTEISTQIHDGSILYDWYDVDVTQTVYPGVDAFQISDWRWNWVLYTLNGTGTTQMTGPVDHSPTEKQEPRVIKFNFLWKVITFQWIDVFPWIRFLPTPTINTFDHSNPETNSVSIQKEAEPRYKGRTEEFSTDIHVLYKVLDGEPLSFITQSQVKYSKGVSLAERHITPPIAQGIIVIQP